MPEWKYTNKTVTKEEAQKSLDAVKSACFKCETHASGCPISKTANTTCKAGDLEATADEAGKLQVADIIVERAGL
jgi:hypothetical protein